MSKQTPTLTGLTERTRLSSSKGSKKRVQANIGKALSSIPETSSVSAPFLSASIPSKCPHHSYPYHHYHHLKGERDEYQEIIRYSDTRAKECPHKERNKHHHRHHRPHSPSKDKTKLTADQRTRSIQQNKAIGLHKRSVPNVPRLRLHYVETDAYPKTLDGVDMARLVPTVKANWKNLHMGGELREVRIIEHPLGHAYCPAQVAVVVDIGLERVKDSQNHHRIELARRAKRIVERDLKLCFTAQSPQLILHSRIAEASEGSAPGRLSCAGVGYAKLVVLWCLQRIETGQVVAGHRNFRTDNAGCGVGDLFSRDAGEQAVVHMAQDVARLITAQVNHVLKENRCLRGCF